MNRRVRNAQHFRVHDLSVMAIVCSKTHVRLSKHHYIQFGKHLEHNNDDEYFQLVNPMTKTPFIYHVHNTKRETHSN